MDSIVIFTSLFFYIIIISIILIIRIFRVKYLYIFCILTSILLLFGKILIFFGPKEEIGFTQTFSISLLFEISLFSMHYALKYLIISLLTISIYWGMEYIYKIINIRRILIQYFCFVGLVLFIDLLLEPPCYSPIHRATNRLWYPLFDLFMGTHRQTMLNLSIITTLIFFFSNLIISVKKKKMKWNT